MNTKANAAVQRAIDTALSEHGELGLQVTACHQGRLVVDAWGGIARPQTGDAMDGNTLICPFSVRVGHALGLHVADLRLGDRRDRASHRSEAARVFAVRGRGDLRATCHRQPVAGRAGIGMASRGRSRCTA